MQGNQQQITALADHLSHRQEALLLAWRNAIKKDPELTSGDSLPRSELFDHIPALLLIFEQGLRRAATGEERTEEDAAQDSAAAHGLQRWKQGYDCREVTREWGKLNECVIFELDRYAKANPHVALDAMTRARQVWTSLCSAGIEASVQEYFALQQREAAGHVKDLESALEAIHELERQRGETWQQAAHDLRGNLAVVANATVGLTRHGKRDSTRDDFVRILMRNVTSLHHLLDDVTTLARLQAGRESRQIEPLDVTAIIQPLCEGIRPLAAQRGLYLKCDGPDGFAADGDAVKIRRIGQNLLLNAVKYTHSGGIAVSWGDSAPEDPRRWALYITDTGPGFHTDSGQPIAAMLESSSEPMSSSETIAPAQKQAASELGKVAFRGVDNRSSRGQAGEGIGLSIVKRLCEMLDATIEMQSVPKVGTTFRILFPRRYDS
ncbi:MAG TPA: HAMP domain-containing sensor histidine kinase [Steroidobacteraceae bacterium]|nr:HAMP domain-containing sensor histidine kinase [Steroidobacteraceae bacterium]